jgi:hypothetical protein
MTVPLGRGHDASEREVPSTRRFLFLRSKVTKS